MKCPVCKIDLVMSERSGVEIDYCPECRGVWLDRGELDKIIERSNQSAAEYQPEKRLANHGSRSHSDSYDSSKKKKKESFLGDLFDF